MEASATESQWKGSLAAFLPVDVLVTQRKLKAGLFIIESHGLNSRCLSMLFLASSIVILATWVPPVDHVNKSACSLRRHIESGQIMISLFSSLLHFASLHQNTFRALPDHLGNQKSETVGFRIPIHILFFCFTIYLFDRVWGAERKEMENLPYFLFTSSHTRSSPKQDSSNKSESTWPVFAEGISNKADISFFSEI